MERPRRPGKGWSWKSATVLILVLTVGMYFHESHSSVLVFYRGTGGCSVCTDHAACGSVSIPGWRDLVNLTILTDRLPAR